ncbi:TPA: hypothetical protein VLM34_000740 [Streptococcus pyogenes]|uniref:hypothetical protein n=1 Tax=Streptococcus pyogenes TaxID=1314 RepID=UPI00109D22D7|nr:hypothetical protein [Streptococcus pyogenes]QCK44426.1 hypothetical protein ETT62_07295 [Streptococcus pyogenes]VHF57947.1 Uncharacterised protein [Streptococcus pyogenes]VHG43744.1 Uncharacterised protein [Streptococcus pyogenes]VHK20923.1 hypothetical membrane associated protein [Streptococcus pyogenes]VHM07035.1 hypothetical membrane associated protein [Streptococcus pyogenes]
MKTKSKRFLNLATLCLALLGTTLLMGQPVKASEQTDDDAVLMNSSGGEGSEQDNYIREQYRSSLGLSQEDFDELNSQPYYEGRLSGYIHGYKDGQRLGASSSPTDDKPYKGSRNDDYKTGFNDGYGSGYHDGWEQTNPFQSLLNYIWGVITDFFFPSSS